MAHKILWASLLLWSLLGCNRNIGAVPESLPEWDTLYFSGKVFSDQAVTDKGVLFVAASPASGGPPPVVVRYEISSLPASFELTDLNLMQDGLKIEGPMRLFARFDSDGDVNTRGRFDQEIRDDNVYALGTTNISLHLKPLADAPAAALQITGTISLPLGSSSGAAASVLFIFAKRPGMPMPLAAQKIERPTFPLDFVLDERALLQNSSNLPELIVFEARLDEDGDPTTKGVNDKVFVSPPMPRIAGSPLQIELVAQQ